jgi:hypothetical protein
MKLLFWRLMAAIDDIVHALDWYDGWDWLTDSAPRYLFCQWSQKGLFREEEKQGKWREPIVRDL